MKLPVKEIVIIDNCDNCLLSVFQNSLGGKDFCQIKSGYISVDEIPPDCPLRTANYLIKLGGHDEK